MPDEDSKLSKKIKKGEDIFSDDHSFKINIKHGNSDKNITIDFKLLRPNSKGPAPPLGETSKQSRTKNEERKQKPNPSKPNVQKQ